MQPYFGLGARATFVSDPVCIRGKLRATPARPARAESPRAPQMRRRGRCAGGKGGCAEGSRAENTYGSRGHLCSTALRQRTHCLSRQTTAPSPGPLGSLYSPAGTAARRPPPRPVNRTRSGRHDGANTPRQTGGTVSRAAFGLLLRWCNRAVRTCFCADPASASRGWLRQGAAPAAVRVRGSTAASLSNCQFAPGWIAAAAGVASSADGHRREKRELAPQ